MKVGRLLGLDELKWRSIPNGLYSVNFHRIGNSRETKFDPCVFSCTTEELDSHIKFFKENFEIIGLNALSQILANNTKPSTRLLCLTFDDGYIDNFTNALPVLQANKVTASFFIATGLVGSHHAPWWDKVAYLIKHHRPKSIYLDSWREKIVFDNCQERFIRSVLHAVKNCQLPAHKQIRQLEQTLLHQNGYPQAEFMDWHHLAKLLEAGMELGAHSHNHDILTKLSEDELFYELSHSKELLESNLGCDVTAFSYPVGNRSTYNKRVIEGLKDTGYELAFNFQTGINVTPGVNPYDLHRFPIAPNMSTAEVKRMFAYAKRY